MSDPRGPIIRSALALHRAMAVRVSSFVGLSKSTPHDVKIDSTNRLTCSLWASSVAGWLSRVEDPRLAFSKQVKFIAMAAVPTCDGFELIPFLVFQ